VSQPAGPDTGSTLHLLTILISAALTDNILLTRFLGMCSFLAISRQMKAALGLGLAVTFVTTITCALNALFYWTLLAPYGLESLQLIVFIVIVAGFVQFLEMFVERVSLPLYYALGIFLPLITVNCAVLGAALFMVNRNYGVVESTVFGFGSGAGWMLAIILMAGIRERLKNAQIPPALEGPGITLIISGIIALGFVGFSGMVQP
jgi:Na+-transporting NADH:ubiquinone oxidoreductase subunit E